jgi:hypothetical protein
MSSLSLPVQGAIDGIWNRQEMAMLHAERGLSGSRLGRFNRRVR